MKIESMKEVLLSKAGDFFLFDCRIGGLDSETLRAYRHVLRSFIDFTGDILVKDLMPDHIRLYIANLSDGPIEEEEHTRIVITHYAIIDEWIRWLYAQESLIERIDPVRPPHLSELFPLLFTKIKTYCA
jgi:hypothetical protein